MFPLIVFCMVCLFWPGSCATDDGTTYDNAPIILKGSLEDEEGSCPPGFKWNVVNQRCEDINECQLPRPPCLKYLCENTIGGYKCAGKSNELSTEAEKEPKTKIECKEGTKLSLGRSTCEDIDECRDGTHTCDQLQDCINTLGGYECRCKHGFELDSSSEFCVDIDECALNQSICSNGLQCRNLLGSFTCINVVTTTTTISPSEDYDSDVYSSEPAWECDEGYEQGAAGGCVDIDECRNGTHSCDQLQDCVITLGGYECRCKHGFELDSSSGSCVDTDECRDGTHTCDLLQDCINTRGGHKCRCKHGFELDSSSASCIDIDECRNGTHSCNQLQDCINTLGGHECRCKHGFELDSSSGSCVDINECRDGTHTCDQLQDCVNTRGGHECRCKHGFELDSSSGSCVDIDECRDGTHTCDQLQDCINTRGGHECNCKNGFELDFSSGSCVDINECRDGTHTCDQLQDCVNTRGGHECRCKHGFELDSSSGSCVDIDECRNGTHTCDQLQDCINTRGGHECNCKNGFELDFFSGSCVDIDECRDGTHTCDLLQDCINTRGGHKCRCKHGFELDSSSGSCIVPSSSTPRPSVPSYENGNEFTVVHYGKKGPYSTQPTYNWNHFSCPTGYMLTPDLQCNDIDECASYTSRCGLNQRCENFHGGHTCWCENGYRLPCAAEHCFNKCFDVDECRETPGVCSQHCFNTLGGFQCYCEKGYRLANDNRTCVDVNECIEHPSLSVSGKLCAGECINEPGSYRCGCPAGYRLSPDKKTCVDIDECATGEAPCAYSSDAGYVCKNTHGSYYCHHIDCPPGYRLDSMKRCVREQTCQVGHLACFHQPGMYCYKFFTFVANAHLPFGKVDFYKMPSPFQSWVVLFSKVNYELRLISVQASPGVQPANLQCFNTRVLFNSCVVSLECSLPGPQVVELELTRSIMRGSRYAGSTVVRLFVIISQYEF
ncbi:fibrillin-2-like isoform X10 [Spodoptera litura]|uniref:Fibrillin-2-like isoform X10 n=1 Tax=Spodoptera litura TaxID=69820 RepID=A0A9J7J4B6_SPOLT|nr:fibrillin-2-like isoform X10 [Spodoptera litura]